MQRKFIGKTKNGIEVSVDMEHSHAATHFKDTSGLFEAVVEAIPMVEAMEIYQQYEIDLGRTIGLTDLVSTTAGDDIVYAMRPNRDIYTRFVKNKKRESTTSIVFSLDKDSDTEYKLHTTYFGHVTPPFPGDPNEKPESREFWNTHALVWGSQEIVPRSERSDCPW